MKLAERAAVLTAHKNAGVLDTLAAAQASAGRFTDAAMTAEKALVLAHSTGDEKLAKALPARIALYKAGKPYRMRLPR